MIFRAGFALNIVGSFVNGIDALSRLCGRLLDDNEFGKSGHKKGSRFLELFVSHFRERLDDALDVLPGSNVSSVTWYGCSPESFRCLSLSLQIASGKSRT